MEVAGCPIHHPLSHHLSVFVFCLSVSTSMLHLSEVPIDGAHVTDICCISLCAILKMCMLFLFVVMYYLISEHQIYLKLVGVFFAIQF